MSWAGKSRALSGFAAGAIVVASVAPLGGSLGVLELVVGGLGSALAGTPKGPLTGWVSGLCGWRCSVRAGEEARPWG